jgi:small subunit ribosomal protein S6
MFVIDVQEVRKGTDDVEEMIRGLINKSGGELAIATRWDERKLAYEIKGRDSGLYMLTYFSGGPEVVKTLTRECMLSSFVLRTLFLRVKEIPDPETLDDRSRREKAMDEAEREDAKRGAAPAPAKAAGAPAAATETATAAADAPAPAVEGEDEPKPPAAE